MRDRVRKRGFRRACRDKRRKQVLAAFKKNQQEYLMLVENGVNEGPI